MGRSIPKPNPIIDALLMSIFVGELGVILYGLRKDPDLMLLLFAFLGAAAISIKLTKLAFYHIGRFISRVALQHLGDPLKKRLSMKKWCDQSWQLVHHVSMGYVEYTILSEEPWWDNTNTLWNQGSKDAIYPEHKFHIKILYLAQLAVYIYMSFSCKFLEEIRKDYIIMMSHHVVSIALLTWSYVIGFLPVGVIVLYLHDISDIPLDLLKMANYLKLEGMQGLFICEMLFVALLYKWTHLRVFLYPSKLLYTTIVEAPESCMPLGEVRDWSNLSPCPPSYFLFNALLIILYCLHIWWTFLIIRLLVGVLTKGAHETGKDEYEGTSDDSDDDGKEN